MVYDPNIGLRAWVGGPPVGAIFAMQAQAEADRQAALQIARDAMRATGAACELEGEQTDGSHGPCGDAAAGRCSTCHQAFCVSHQSRDVQVPVTNQRYLAQAELCQACQTQWINQDLEREVRAQHARAAAAEAERQRVAQQEEIAKADRARIEKEHAQKVAQHEAEAGWSEAQQKIARLNQLINRRAAKPTVKAGGAFGAVLIVLATIIALAVSIAGYASNQAGPAGFGAILVFILFWPSLWAVWALTRLIRQSSRQEWIKQRDVLYQASGCGAVDCSRCRR